MLQEYALWLERLALFHDFVGFLKGSWGFSGGTPLPFRLCDEMPACGSQLLGFLERRLGLVVVIVLASQN